MAKFLKDIVKDVAADSEVNLTQGEIELVLRKAFNIAGDYLADNEKLYLIGFMNFEPRDYKAKNTTHPQNGTPMVIPPYRTVLSKPSEALKDKLAEGLKRNGKV